MVRFDGLSKAEVLAALYNRARCQGFGVLEFKKAKMSVEQAEILLSQQTYFDYIKGRVLKVDLSGEEGFDERLYDRDNGEDLAQMAVDDYKLEKNFVNNL